MDVIELLRSADAALDLQDSDGWTALYIAAQEGQLEAMQLLVSLGAGYSKFSPLSQILYCF